MSESIGKPTYYERNKEKCKRNHEKYRELRREYIKNYSKEYNKTVKKNQPVLWRAKSMLNALKTRNKYQFNRNDTDITLGDILAILEVNSCYYCGCEFTYKTDVKKGSHGCRDSRTPSIDKVDPTKPYMRNNCVICCHTCNRKKNNNTLDDLKMFIAGIEAHNRSVNNV